LSVTCNRSVIFSRYSSFLHQYNWPPRYNWNIVESGVKHHKLTKLSNRIRNTINRGQLFHIILTINLACFFMYIKGLYFYFQSSEVTMKELLVKLKVPVHKIKLFLEENVTGVNQHQTCQRMLCILNLVEIIISRLSILQVRVMVFNTTFSNISVISWRLTFYSCIMFLPIVFNFIPPKF
jgi:hypothetical protein